MGIYKLSFASADGEVVDLPASINKFTDVDALKEFAAQHGYDPKGWGDDHEQVLKKVFKRAAIKRIEPATPANDVGTPGNGSSALVKNVESLPSKDTTASTNPDDWLIHGVDWKPFLDAVKEESGLFPQPDSVVRERIQNGSMNGIVDGNGKLIATINVGKKFINGMRAKLDIEDEPETQVYETGAGWAAHPYRGLGLYTKFRKDVLESEGISDKLIFSQARGKGASNVNIREGWALINPAEIPFASALMGWPVGDGYLGQKFKLASGVEIELPDQGIYADSTLSFAAKDKTGVMSQRAQRFVDKHEWAEYFHLWVNDPSKAKALDTKLREKHRVSDKDNVTRPIVEHAYKGWLETIERTHAPVEQKVADDEGWSAHGQVVPGAPVSEFTKN